MSGVVLQDRFNPVLLNSPALAATQEQLGSIRAVLDTACSDSAFAEKAYRSIVFILMSGLPKRPVVLSIAPSTVAAGSAPLAVTVNGENFTPQSQVIFNGMLAPTTYMSAVELRATLTIPATGPARNIPLFVYNEPTGVVSGPILFALTDVVVP